MHIFLGVNSEFFQDIKMVINYNMCGTILINRKKQKFKIVTEYIFCGGVSILYLPQIKNLRGKLLMFFTHNYSLMYTNSFV